MISFHRRQWEQKEEDPPQPSWEPVVQEGPSVGGPQTEFFF